MTTSQTAPAMITDEHTTVLGAREIFDDPVSYLASYGIEAEVVAGSSLRAAA